MPDLRAADIDRIDLKIGERRMLESLRLPVAPPFVMLVPFLDLPPGVRLLRQLRIDEEGMHGCTYEIEATAAGRGDMRLGFRDLRSQKIVAEKEIRVVVR